jgi:hypothetical protein
VLAGQLFTQERIHLGLPLSQDSLLLHLILD